MPRPHYLAPPRDRRASRASANLPAWLPRPVPRAAPPSPPSAAPVPAEPGDGAWVAWGLTARRGRTGRAGRHAGRGCGDGWVRAGDTKDLSARPEVPRPGARAESCVGKSAAPGGGGGPHVVGGVDAATPSSGAPRPPCVARLCGHHASLGSWRQRLVASEGLPLVFSL
jgi:hypothetical protein